MAPRGARDPAAPKSATSAQQYFVKSRREALKLAKPDLSSTELQKELADEWRDLPESQREPFITKAKSDKARHSEEISNYVPDVAHLKATKGGKRLQKDPLRPKKPKSAYLYFMEATRNELSGANPGIRIEALSKLIGEEWRKLTDEQKAPYIAQADADQERYREAMAGYAPSSEYLEAAAAFKASKKGGTPGAGSSSDALVSAEAHEELLEENESLKRKIIELEKEVKTKAKTIASLEKKIEKKIEKKESKDGPKAKEPKPPPAKKAKTIEKASEEDEEEELVYPADEAHYIEWTTKILGKKGEKADEQMVSVYKSKGPAGLAKLLAKRYKAEFK